MLYMDLDYFKAVNDRYGHSVGDKVLVEVAGRLAGAVRPGDIPARFGGEEFVVFLPDTSLKQAESVAKTIKHQVEAEMCHIGSLCVEVSVSIGIAAETGRPGRLDELVRQADEALYRAKEDGRNCIRC